jgi:hypothetical protein
MGSPYGEHDWSKEPTIGWFHRFQRCPTGVKPKV